MATLTFVDFSNAETQRLADLSGVEADLSTTENFCDRLDAELKRQPLDILLIEALSAAALIKYGRTFASGVRTGVPAEVISNLPPDQQAAHQLFKDLRDKWVAHSVNAFEDTKVVAYLVSSEKGNQGVSSIGVQHTRVLSLSRAQVALLKQLASAVRVHIRALIKNENAKALECARSRAPEAFYIQVDPPPQAPSTADPSKRRPRW